MKFVTSSDWHLDSKGPVSRKDNWPDTMFAKLNQLAKLAIHVKAKGIICGGDIFNKDSRVDWRLMTRLLEWCLSLKNDGITVYAVPGNHDLKNDRYDSILSQPIGVLFSSGAVIDVSYNPVVIEESTGDVNPFTVVITGIPYPAACSMDAYKGLPTPVGDKSILVAHCFATLAGGDYFGEPILKYADLYLHPYDVFVFGHDHSDNGVVALQSDPGPIRLFINNGALSRGSISRENIERTVKCTLLELTREKTVAQEIKLNVRPVSEVFDLALKAQKDKEESHVEEFVMRLSHDLVETGDLDIQTRVDRMDLIPEVRKRVKIYITESEKEVS